ncbi:hypothetical protein HED54_23035 [Ochrobactrum anthropi ATCC 49188]|nr:hypothetical protein [Brucella anthropi ATCC 49188]
MQDGRSIAAFLPELHLGFIVVLISFSISLRRIITDHLGGFCGSVIVELLGLQLLTEDFLQIRNTGQRRVGVGGVTTQIIDILLLIVRISDDDLTRRNR